MATQHIYIFEQTCVKNVNFLLRFCLNEKAKTKKKGKRLIILFRFGTKRFLQTLGLCVADLRRKIGTKLKPKTQT